MQISRLDPGSPAWPRLTAHLQACGQARWVVAEDGQPLEADLVFLAALTGAQVVGSLTLKHQPVTIPESEWAADRDRVLRDPDGQPYRELFVQTFFVDQDQRRKGIGRALQLKALETARELGCLQMRSWSSLDKPANYELKLSLGFGFHPEIQVTPSGLKVSGGYFVKRV